MSATTEETQPSRTFKLTLVEKCRPPQGQKLRSLASLRGGERIHGHRRIRKGLARRGDRACHPLHREPQRQEQSESTSRHAYHPPAWPPPRDQSSPIDISQERLQPRIA